MDDFFKKKYCSRCGNKLRVRIMSWFTNEVICLECSEEEDEIKDNLNDPEDYENCGYIPD